MSDQETTKVIIKNKVVTDNDKSDIKSSTTESEITSNKSNNTINELEAPDGEISHDSISLIKGRYQLEKIIGQGGLCDVYLAKDLILESSGASQPFVALKVLRDEFSDQPDIARVMFREAQNAQKLSHPNIIRVFDFGIDQGRYYIVMEYLEGETLECVIKRSRPKGVGKRIAYEVIEQLLDAINYAHSIGIVHADIKPSNIMVCGGNILKILDFGVSQTRCIRKDKYSAQDEKKPDQLLGYTPNYASLNILSGKEPSVHDDIFSVACIFYELIGSKHPYNKKTVEEANGAKIQRPKSLPVLTWIPLNRILSNGNCSQDFTATDFKKSLYKSYFKPIIAVLMFGSVCATSFAAYTYHQAELNKANNQIASRQVEINTSALQLETPAHVLIDDIDAIRDFDPVIQAGLIRTHKDHIIGITERKIDKLLNIQDSYPDYAKIESVISFATRLYPDSHRLEMQLIDIENSQNTLLLSLSRRINSQLEDEAVLLGVQEGDSFELFNALSTISTEYEFVLSPLAQQVFSKTLKESFKNFDYAGLISLHRYGNKFFSQTESGIEHLAQLNSTIVHIEKLRAYQVATEEGNTTFSFPEDSARVLFGKQLENIDTSMDKPPTIRRLDHSLKLIRNLSDYFPDDASDILERKEQLANKYAKHSETLKKSRKRRSARIALSRSKDLLKEIDQAGQ